jgi:L-fucose mutarotase
MLRAARGSRQGCGVGDAARRNAERSTPDHPTTMLKGIHPLLTPDLLHVLAGMGHGDEIGIVDANFPATRLGPRVIDLAGASAPEALVALLTVLPLDTDTVPAALTMQVIGDPDALPEVVGDFAAVFDEFGLADCEIGALERHAFYERARRALALVRTGELRPYGNILLVKGVINRYEPAR